MSAPSSLLPSLRLGRIRLVRVADKLEWFARRYLHERERAMAAALRIDKRRIDFVAGRVAAKRALARGREVYVLPETGDRAGAPIAYAADGRRLEQSLSIAHGAGWACAAASDGAPIGIDIERIEPRPPSFLDEAFASGELARWGEALSRAALDPLVVTVAWCAKEALLKRAGVGLRLPLPAVTPTRLAWHTTAPPSDGTLAWADGDTDVFGRCLLAVQLPPRQHLAFVLAA